MKKAPFSNFKLSTQTIAGATGYTQELQSIDVNRDGYYDLLGVSMHFPLQDAPILAYVLVNNTHASFDDASTGAFSDNRPGTVHPREIVVADFNGDDLDDIFIVDHGFDGPPFPGHRNVLLLQDANGYFRDATSNLPSLSDFSHSADAADIDNDGDIDLYVGNLAGGAGVGPYFLINDGQAHFVADQSRLPLEISGTYETKVTSLFLDTDRDGDSDLFLGSDVGGIHRLLINTNGNFQFSSADVPIGIFGDHNTITLDAKQFDFDRDGLTDILLSETRGDPFYAGSALQVLRSNGDGSFSDQTAAYIDKQPGTNDWIRYANFVDLNDDGSSDIICQVDGPGSEYAVAYINDGSNHFFKLPADAVEIRGSFEPIDTNNDGRMDLVSVSDFEGQRHLTILTQANANIKKLRGGNEDDTILGGIGNQKINGNKGNDFTFGSNGKDKIFGDAGADKLLGGSGNDYLAGGVGKDVLIGGQRHDKFVFEGPKKGNDKIVDFISGKDKIVLFGNKFGKFSPGKLVAKYFFI